VQRLYCPGCKTLIGNNDEELPILCWKCGVIFGDTIETRPVAREEVEPFWFSPLCYYGALLVPQLVIWLLWGLLPFVPSPIAKLPFFGSLSTLGCIVLWLASTLFCLDRMLTEDRGSLGWLLRLIAFFIFTIANFIGALIFY